MEISDFTRDITAEAEAGLIERPIGREQELKSILQILSQDTKSNVLIVGPAGSGKTALAEGIAYIISQEKAKKTLPKSKLIELNITAMNSGAMYVGQFEERVTKFLSHIESNPDIVIFIDEIHMIMGFGRTGDSGTSRDFSQIIKPMLASGDLCCMGATTKHEYETYIASDSAFVRRFQILELPPLQDDIVLQILHRIAVKIKYNMGLNYSDQSLKEIVAASEIIYPNRFQPDKSIDILKRISSSLCKNIELSHVKKKKDIELYLSLLKKEITALKREDYSSLRNTAAQWLGVEKRTIENVQLTKSKIMEILKPTRA